MAWVKVLRQKGYECLRLRKEALILNRLRSRKQGRDEKKKKPVWMEVPEVLVGASFGITQVTMSTPERI